MNLVEGDSSVAPAYDGCPANPTAVLQTVRARDQGGRFLTVSRESGATASAGGTVWETIVRCDGTLTVVHHGTVVVADFQLHQTVAIHAGQRYLAHAP